MEGKQDISPFKFLDSYTKADRDIFFGRDLEVEEVHSKISQSKLLLIYGASGTGKSSIINCGLANKFHESDWLPIHIRRGGNILRSTYKQISREAIQTLTMDEGVSQTTIYQSLSSVFLDHFKPIYLIFDQFEELFIFGKKEEWVEFIKTIHYLTESELDVHFIFVIRGEYLEFLSEFEEMKPDFFDNRVRIEKMTRKKAIESITGPSKLFSIQLDDEFGEKLLQKLSPDKSQIELTFLQVFLDKIYKNARARSVDGSLSFSNEDIEKLGQIEDVLAEFVDEQLFNMKDSRAALSVLKSFVSLQGTKAQRDTHEVHDHLEDIGTILSSTEIEQIIQEFVNTRILRDKDEQGRYELRHDSLANKIYEKITLQERELLDVKQFLVHSLNEYNKRGILLNDEDLMYIASQERNLKLDAQTIEFIELSKNNSGRRKKARKTRTIVATIIISLFITSVFGFIYSLQQKSRAELLADQASKKSIEATRQAEIAQNQREIAEENFTQAEQQKRLALQESERANQASTEARQQRNLALNQSQIAEWERSNAELARLESEKNAAEALKQKAIADTERQNALRLRMLALARAMSIKSTHIVDPELKSLLALQAYRFNEDFGGGPFQPDLYQSLYLARKEYWENQYNQIKLSSDAIKSMVKDKSGNIYATTSDGQIFILQPGKDKPVFEKFMSINMLIESTTISEDLKSLFLGSQQGDLIRVDLVSKSEVFRKEIHTRDISDILIINNNTLVTGSLDGTIQFSDISGNLIRSIDLQNGVIDLDMNYTRNEILVLTKSNEIIIMDQYGKEIKRNTIQTRNDLVMISTSPSGRIVSIGFQHGQVLLYEYDQWTPIQNLLGHTAAITDLTYDNEEQYLISSSFDRSVRVWKLNNLDEQAIVLNDQESWVSEVTLIQNKIMTGDYEGTIKQYPVDTKTLIIDLCARIERNLTMEEWNEHIAIDLTYQSTCE